MVTTHNPKSDGLSRLLAEGQVIRIYKILGKGRVTAARGLREGSPVSGIAVRPIPNPKVQVGRKGLCSIDFADELPTIGLISHGNDSGDVVICRRPPVG